MVRLEPVEVQPLDVVVVLDLSASMTSERLVRARGWVRDLLSAPEAEGSRVALVVFGRAAWLLAPFTSDHRAVAGLLEPADGVDGRGSDAAAAVARAVRLLQGSTDGRVLVLSDGGPHHGVLDLRQLAAFLSHAHPPPPPVIVVPLSQGGNYADLQAVSAATRGVVLPVGEAPTWQRLSRQAAGR